MKLLHWKSWLLAFLLWMPLAASAQTYLEFGDSVQGWLDARLAQVQAGHRERVEMPLCVRSRAWGCMCPDAYIGTSPNVQEGPWIWAKGGKQFPKVDEQGHSLIITGSFTGKWKTQDLRNPDGEPADWLYKMPVFKVRTWRENTSYDDTPAPRVLNE